MDVSRAEAATAVGAAVGAVAGSFAVAGRTPAFVAAPVSSLVVDLTPGAVMTAAIQQLGDWSHRLALGVALLVAVGLFAGVALVAVRLGRRSEVPYTSVAVAGFVGWLLAVVATGAPKQSVAPAGVLAVSVAVAERGWAVGRDRPHSRVSVSTSRRKAMAAVGALAGFVGFAGYRGAGITGVEPGPIANVTDEETQSEADRLLDRTRGRSLAVANLPGLVTPTEEFYEVDVNNVNPNPSDGTWELSVTGAVEREVSVDFAELAGMADAIEHRFVTLRCVGEALNGKKMDTALWTGIPVSTLLDRAGVDASGTGSGSRSGSSSNSENCCVMVRAVDGYYEEFPLAALRDGFLAFGMNGRRLPRGHGYPVRLLVPGHWGEINVKWVTEIEVLEAEKQGFWEKRGWHGTGPVNTVAKLHAVNHLGDGQVQVGGHAYAGTRGVATVEVSTDGGQTWEEAELSEPLPGGTVGRGSASRQTQSAEDAWRQWRYEWDADPGEHEVVVRAIDGEGDVQPEEFSQPYPSGPTGWVSRTVEA